MINLVLCANFEITMSCRNIKIAFNAAAWVPTETEWLFCGQCIELKERKRISEFCFKNDAKLSLVARLLIRYALCICTPLTWQQIHLKRTLKGKPYLESEHKAFFNASHQGDYVVVAANNHSMVGIDVMDTREKHGDTQKFFSLMNRQFTEQEWGKICSYQSDSEKMKSFYRHWCLKESYVKATGDGISFPLLSLSFVSKSEITDKTFAYDTLLFRDNCQQKDWSFKEIMLKEHCIAIAENVKMNMETSDFIFPTFLDLGKKMIPLEATDTKIDEDFRISFYKPIKTKKL